MKGGNKFFGPLNRWRKKDWFHWEDATRTVEYCGEKVIYHTWAEAESKRIRQEEKSNKPLRVYECPHGPHYHLTSKTSY